MFKKFEKRYEVVATFTCT